MKFFSALLMSFVLVTGNSQETLTTFNGALPLTLDHSTAMVKFEPGVGTDVRKTLFDPQYFQPFDAEINKPQFNYAFVSLKDGLSSEEIFSAIDELSGNPLVQYASVMYRMPGGQLCAPTNQVTVGLKSPDELNGAMNYLFAEFSDMTFYFSETRLSSVVQINFSINNTVGIFEIAEELSAKGFFRYCEPDMVVLVSKTTDDPLFDYQWAINNTGSDIQYDGIPGADLGAICAWEFTRGAGSKVAILDEGVDLTHDDLTPNLLPGYDACYWGGGGVSNSFGGFEPGSDDAHGTNCAGIVCAIADNDIGVTGIAPESNVVPVRIAYSNAFGWVLEYDWVVDAIMWAIEQAGADILSNSYILGAAPASVSDAIDFAITEGRDGLGSIFVAAAGNFNSNTLEYPGKYDNAIGVAATSMCDERKSPSSCDGENFWGSNYGSKLDVAAPGVKIPSTDISGGAGYAVGDHYLLMNGTSAATPYTAGVLALMLSLDPGLTYEEARFYLENNCEKAGDYTYSTEPDHPNGTWNNEMGYGRVDACNVLTVIAENLIKPDLISEIASISDELVNPGDAITLDYSLANSGFSDAGTFNSKIYISDDCAVGDDIELVSFSTASLNVDEVLNLNEEMVIPENTAAGDYRILVYADQGGAIDEAIEMNNVACIDITVECSYLPGDAEVFYSFAAVTDSFEIETSSGCIWNMTPAPPAWIDIINGSGTGAGYFVYALEANDEIFERSFTFHYGGFDYTINQARQNAVSDINPMISIFPNPATDLIQINGITGEGWYTIINSTGEKVQAGELLPANTTIDLKTMARGIYVIQLHLDEGVYAMSLILGE